MKLREKYEKRKKTTLDLKFKILEYRLLPDKQDET